MAGKNKKITGNGAESSTKASLSDKKTPGSLKPRRKIVKKPPNSNAAETKEAKTTSQVQTSNEDKKKTMKGGKQESKKVERDGGKNVISHHGNKEQKSINEEKKDAKTTAQVQTRNEDKRQAIKGGKQEHKQRERDGGKNLISHQGNKEQKTTSQVQTRNEDKRQATKGGKQEHKQHERDGGKNLISHQGNKEQKSINEKREETSKRDQKDDGNLGGLVFMCNAKTKPDCFRYQVMGVPTNKQGIVMAVKPGLKLFLYDFDVKVMYGIYKASSAGGMKLEPAAFGGAFPVQVRFKVHEDCLPLPESVFKKAIKENYIEKTQKFKIELTVQQVKKLTSLFRPVTWMHANAQSSLQRPLPTTVIPYPPPATTKPGVEVAHWEHAYRDHHSSSSQAAQHRIPSNHERKQFSKHSISPPGLASSDPLFLSEKEYRNYGLRPGRHIMATDNPSFDPYSADREREQLQDETLTRNEDIHSDPLFLSEKEYRAYGLKVRQEPPTSALPTIEPTTAMDTYQKDSYYPYHDDTTSLVERYLPQPRTMAAPSESYSLSRRDNFYADNDTRNHPGRVVTEGSDRLYSTYASRGISDYNQNYQHLGEEPRLKTSGISDYNQNYQHLGEEPRFKTSGISDYNQNYQHLEEEPRFMTSGISDYNQNYQHLGEEPRFKTTPVSSRYSFAGPSSAPYR